MNILFVNENGQGNHHIDCLLWAAKIFSANGAKCIFALKDRDHKVLEVMESGFEVFQGPRLNMPKKGFASFADTLANMGVTSKNALKYLVTEWEFQFRQRKIDCIVSNFAPIVLQVARDKIPTINIATPWETPHSSLSEVPLFSGLKKIATDDDILANLSSYGFKNLPSSLVLALQGDFPFFIFEKGFDYPANLNSRGTGYPFLGNPTNRIKKPRELNIFIYIHNEYPRGRQIKKTIVDCLKPLGCNVDIYDPITTLSIGPKVKHVGRLTHKELTSKYNLVIHAGGLGLSQLLYASKVFQIVIPQHAEQRQNALSLKKLSAGVMLPPDPVKIYDKLTGVLEEKLNTLYNFNPDTTVGLTHNDDRNDYLSSFISLMKTLA